MPQTNYFHVKTIDSTAFINVQENPIDYNKPTRDNKQTKLLKRIPLERLMDLKIDFAFKQLFGNEKNKQITIVFLNAILQKTGRGIIKDVVFANVEQNREYDEDKESRLDLLVVTDAGETINVEVQFSDKHDMAKRSIFYWSRLYKNLLGKSMDYKQLRPVISINILNYDYFSQTERFHTSYHLSEDVDRYWLSDVVEFHFIEMTKLIKYWKQGKLNPWEDVLARWLLMLGMVDHRHGEVYDDIYKELEEIAMNDESLRDAFENWEELSMTREQVLQYESRLKVLLDKEAERRQEEERKQEIKRMEKDLYEKEKHVGEKEKHVDEKEKYVDEKEKYLDEKEKHLAQTIDEAEYNAKKAVAIRLLKQNIAIDVVVKSTGLDEEAVAQILQEMDT